MTMAPAEAHTSAQAVRRDRRAIASVHVRSVQGSARYGVLEPEPKLQSAATKHGARRANRRDEGNEPTASLCY